MFSTDLIAPGKFKAFSKIAAGMLAFAAPAIGFSQAMPRIQEPISDSVLTTLRGSVHPLARPEFDLGPVEDSHVGRMLLVLKRSPEQQAALQQLIEDQQNSASSNFHKWLTPEQFGQQFGIADADVQTVSGYLQDHGFSVGRIYKNRGAIEVSGTAGQLRNTFHTRIHRYSIQGKEFYANANAPQIPTALTPVVLGFAALNDIRTSKLTGSSAESIPVTVNPETKKLTPAYTSTYGGSPIYLLAPTDIQSIYDIPVLSTSPGGGGTGVTVGVIGDSQINLDLIARYQRLGGAGKTTPTEIVDGNDPGILPVTGTTPDATIAYQQLELIGAAAPYANINYYVSADTDYDNGLNFAIIRAVDDNAISVLSLGFQNCEANLGPNTNSLMGTSWEQAAAQGITVVVAAGDSGSAGCDLPGSTTPAAKGLGINGYASTPYNVAVGGTDFSYAAHPATYYWSSTAGGSVTSSSLPIPEQAWNDSIQTHDVTQTNPILNAGGGGFSTLGNVADDVVTQSPYPVPSWQVNAQIAAGIASPTARAIPDVSFFAGNNYNSSEYVICASPSDCTSSFAPTNATITGGTAGAAAVFAGIMADVVGKFGLQGNINPLLYNMSTKTTGIFRDVTVGTNSVACTTGTPNCTGGTIKTGTANSYLAGTGYDLATGLGSVDATNLINGWIIPATKTSATSLSIVNSATQTPITSIVHGTNLDLKAKVTGTGGTPTGDVAFTTNSSLPSYGGISAATLSGGSAISQYNYFLPGGTYTVSARYAGDTTFLPSVGSAPITVTPEPSRTFIFSSTYPSGSTLTYGTTNNVTAEPFSLNKNNVSTPTGTLSVFDGNVDPVTVMPLNSEGTATYNTNLLAAGNTYTIVFNYSGDPSYQISNSSATPYTVTINKAPTTISLTNSGSLSNYSPVGLTAVVSSPALTTTPASTSTGVSPTGTVTFTNSAGTQTVVNVTAGFNASGQAISTATLPVSSAQTQAQVSLTGSANVDGIFTDGSILINNGLDGGGSAYSGNLLGTTLTLAGTTFNFGNANRNDMVEGAATAPVITLTSGNYTTLKFLGTAVNGNQPGQVFTVKYSDGTTQQYTQSMSDWYTPQSYTGENVASSMTYRDDSNIVVNKQNGPFNLYEYAIPLNSAKTVTSLTLPANADVVVAAVTLVNNPAQAYTAVYSGDTNYATSSTSGSIAANTANYIGTSGLSISLNNTTVAANGSLIVTANATQSTGTPTGTVQVFANGVSIGSFAVSSGSATPWTVPLTGGYLPLPSGTVTLTAVFTPTSATLTPSSASTTVTVTDNRTNGDFSITTDTHSQTITSSSNVTYFQVQLSSIQNMAGVNTPINLTCTVPASSNLGCTLQASATLDATGNATVSLDIYGQPNGGTGALQMPVPAQHWWLIGGGSTLACIFLLGIPARRKTWQGLVSLFVCAIVVTGSITGCGTNSTSAALANTATGTSGTQGGNGGGGSLTPGYTNGLATNKVNPGTYNVVITGTSSVNTTLTHNTSVSVVVNTGQSFANGSYSLTSIHSALLITDPGGVATPGTGLAQYVADGTSDQKWVFTYQNNGYFTITNQANGLFLTDPGGVDGTGPVTQVTQASMIGTVAAPDGTQLWTLYANEGGYEIVNAQSGGVLDDDQQTTTQGTPVICYPEKAITDSGNQTWYIQPAP